MPKIKSVRLRNFQPHEDLTVDLGPRVTTLVGHTEAGKTSVLRAFEWLFLNRPPRGKAGSHVRYGADRCSVSAVVDGTRVTRGSHRKGGHYYKVGKGPKLKAVGRGAPPPAVTKLLPVDDDNFQRVYDQPFWFTLSAGQVGRNLNGIVDLEIMDTILARGVAEARDVDRRIKDIKLRLKESRRAKDKLSRVNHFARRLRRLKAQKREARETALALRRIDDLLRVVQLATAAKKTAGRAKIEGLRAIRAGRELVKLRNRLNRARELLNEVKVNRPGKPIPDIQPLLDMRKRADEIAERCSMAESVLENYQSIKREVNKWLRKKTELQTELDSHHGKKCPVCRQILPKSFSRSLRMSTPA